MISVNTKYTLTICQKETKKQLKSYTWKLINSRQKTRCRAETTQHFCTLSYSKLLRNQTNINWKEKRYYTKHRSLVDFLLKPHFIRPQKVQTQHETFIQGVQ